ncbi:MAG TPA: patatin-like phospholipase family protein [Pyrinomonadaceae bacterium]|nr:patatin-like phospholipase family protein [Pyrinomonadaceae bacterium]
MIRFATACLLVFFTGVQPSLSQQAQNTTEKNQSPLVIRVGAIYYDNSAEQYQRIRAILSAFESAKQTKTKRPIAFKLVVGTYDEVYHWYKSDQIDLAVMNPGPLALLLRDYGHEQLSKGFVGTRGLVPNETSIASEGGQVANDTYNSVMLVNRRAIRPLEPSLADKLTLLDHEAKRIVDLVLDKTRQGQTYFLFVHPFSTSGYIFPRKFLKEKTGVDLKSTDYELTDSHTVSLNEIRRASNPNGRLKVAFVSDYLQATKDDKDLLAIRSGDFSTKIVQDALLFTPDFVQRESADLESVKELLRSSVGATTFNLSSDVTEWWKPYEEIARWIETFNGNKPLLSNNITLDQIIKRINNYNIHHPEKPARVALVLSGGGAKCAYQLGAVEVIEDRLKQAQEENRAPRPSIDLVVGTSGGAINALTIAAEVTKEGAGRRDLRSTWERFSQSEILKPSNFVRRLFGVTIGLIFSLVVINVFLYWRLWRYASGTRSLFGKLVWTEKAGILLLVVSLLLYLIGLKQLTLTDTLPAETLLDKHVLIHIAEYSRQALRWAALCIFVFGFILTLNRTLSSLLPPYGWLSRNLRVPAIVTAVLLLFLLPIATIVTTFTYQDTLFLSSGIEEKMAVEMPKLLHCDASSGSSSQRLANISTQIIRDGLIKRDLVITGSVLSSGSASRQSDAAREAEHETDLYFLYKAGNGSVPDGLRKDNRFVSLKDPENESILLDVVVGSGSIFPAFEAKKLTHVKRMLDKSALTDVSIIDGGFVHNSPIEAAIKLEATHIIMIEASPEYAQSSEVSLLSNSVVAFNHLFTQAQLLDARSRRQAEIFTLRPHQDPFLCTMDFGKNYILKAMEWGASDASDTATPRFVRQPRPSGL